MKRLLLGAAAIALLAGMSAPAFADYTLTILHTNDFHSRIEPINKYDSTCGEKDTAEGKCFGGSARLDTAIKERRAADPNSLLVDGGDQFQGSLFYTYYKGKAAAELMNTLGYDAMTVGNHEFDDGPEVLRGFMDAIKFPILLSNADVSKEPTLADVLKPSTIIEKDGQKIGLIGLTPRDAVELSSPGKNITFTDPEPALKREIAKLQAEGVNKIIVLSHSGYKVDQRIAASVDGIDVIVGGHSHTYLSSTDDKAEGPYPTWVDAPDGTRVPIVQAASYGKFLGELKVTFDDDGKVIDAVGAPIIMDNAVAEDATIKARVHELAGPLEEIRAEVVADTAAPIDGNRDTCRAKECEMGNLVADAMLAHTASQGVTIAIQNGGGLRASIDEGPVTMGEILTVLPFQNTVATFQLTGKGIVAALENGVSQVEEGAGRFPQVAGLKYTWTKAAKPNEGRIKSVEVKDGDGWAPIDPDKTYLVVTNDYMRRGGDGYSVFATDAQNAYDFGPNLENVVIEYMTGANAPYQPYVDGRVTEAE
ncbi:Trifunctional nucleotide phosphoesterase protein YfkN precursor [Hartmannibacter diazotrophicus]|uniref:Trifunctional nucleotide phosphoesterase protein YfkN n=1 Tax=Hartmannibacter diazotrophicus TaxID=1482074 RepID=A0A2C9D2M4_9HYPH|nr:5'-nucleotidase C-terminal domain-containing protein [Hartmannibacter diazotrophicus]SON54510.1 Trifunctional nucleotide phosphoesterase protein YfkN precursor [Hartmannibacter diazotrophicus]